MAALSGVKDVTFSKVCVCMHAMCTKCKHVRARTGMVQVMQVERTHMPACIHTYIRMYAHTHYICMYAHTHYICLRAYIHTYVCMRHFLQGHAYMHFYASGHP